MKIFLFILINAGLLVVTGCASSPPKATATADTAQSAPVAKTSNGSREQNNVENGTPASGNTDTAGSQSNQPPEVVLESFKSQYPEYTSNDWTMQQGKYSTTYMKEGILYNAFFTPGGQWIGTETGVVMGDLPDAVKKAYQNGLYGKAANPRIARIESSKYPVIYRVEGQMNNQSRSILTRKGKNCNHWKKNKSPQVEGLSQPCIDASTVSIKAVRPWYG